MNRRVVVREDVSLHHGGSIKGTPETLEPSQHHRIEGFKGALNWAPIGPLCNLSDNKFIFSSLAKLIFRRDISI